VALDPFRPVTSLALDDGESPSGLVPIRALGGVAVLDAATGTAHLVDGRYHHDPTRHCVEASAWPSLEGTDDWVGRCEAGEVEVGFGELAPEVPLVAVAPSADDGLVALGRDGTLYLATGELLGVNPLAFLRPVAYGTADAASGDARLAVASDGTAWIADQGVLTAWSLAGAARESVAIPDATTLVLSEDRPWLATEQGLWVDGDVVDLGGAVLGLADGVASTAGAVHFLASDGSAAASVAVDGVTGPVARDARTGMAWVATGAGIASVTPDGIVTTYETDAPTALLVHAADEIVALAGTEVSAWWDETALADAPSLQVALATFVENPKQSGDKISCDEGEESMNVYLARAARNRALLDDLPAPAAFAVTPAAVRTAVDCDMKDRLTALVGERTELGVLFHEAPEVCEGDQDCFQDKLARDLNAFSSNGLDATWSTGPAAWDVDGVDWVQGLLALDLPPRHLFFGLAAEPEVVQADPRAKEPYRWRADASPAAFHADRADSFGAGASEGLAAYAGNPVASFYFSHCPDLLVAECIQAGAGGDALLQAGDTVVLDLLLHRALASAEEGAVNTWYFHLPAIELYDYTEGCTTEDRRWSGEDCQGARIQDWLYDVHARWVEAGRVEWSLPGEWGEPG
jgi:hypothetical protein